MDNTNELQHHGIKGQRWGIRRYQNADGTLTPAGKKREAKLDRKLANQAYKYNQIKKKKLTSNTTDRQEQKENLHKKKNVNKMTNDELREKAARLELENRYVSALSTYNKLNPQPVSKGKAFIKKIANDVLVAAATEAGKNIVRNMIENSFDIESDKKKKKNKKK